MEKPFKIFISNLFGWEINANNPMNYGIVDHKGSGINGGIGPTDGSNRVTVYVEVSDLEATLEKAIELSGKVIQPITEIPNTVSFALFADGEGNVIGIIKSQR